MYAAEPRVAVALIATSYGGQAATCYFGALRLGSLQQTWVGGHCFCVLHRRDLRPQKSFNGHLAAFPNR